MDEMERAVLTRSEGWGYRALLLAMSAWVLGCCLTSALSRTRLDPLPGLVLLFGSLVQGVSRLVIGRRLASGGEEPHEPNRLLLMLVEITAIVAALVAMGACLVSGA